MDVRRALPFLLLVICVISAASAIRNEPNNIRRIRRIGLNEYLVPPPLPSKIRIGRYAPQPTEAPGYFTWFMSWLNPFSSPSEPQLTEVVPPPPQQRIPPSSMFFQPPSSPFGPPSTVYGGPSPTAYEKPPPLSPISSVNDNSGYPPSTGKSCNSCNKVPWTPVNGGSHSGGDVSAPSPPLLPELPSLNGDYPPSRNVETTYDAHYAASHNVRAPGFSSASPSFPGQDGPFVGPSSNPHLYTGALPPLFNAGDFNYPVASPSGSTDDGANNGLTGNNGQSVYPVPSSPSGGVYQELEYNNAGTSNGGFNNFAAHNDLSSSGTQVSHGHVDPLPNKQGYENTATHQSSPDFINQQTSFGSADILNQQPSAAPNNGVFYDVTGPNAPLGDFLDNSSQINQNLPSSYGISGFGQIPNNYEHRYNNLPTVAKDSHASSTASDGSSAKIEKSIHHFEQSPLLDFTRKGESRTDSSSIPPASNVVAHFESTKIAATTLAPGNFGTRQGSTSTESYFSANHVQTIMPSAKSKINNNVNSGSDSTNLRGQDVSYIPPSGQAGFLWSNTLHSTIPHVTERDPFWNPTAKSYDDVAEEILNENVNSKDTTLSQEGAKRNKKVQVIIPYTSQYTPQPFQSGKVPYTGEADHDSYVGEESRNSIKVTSPPDSSYTIQSWPTALEDVTKKPNDVKSTNFIKLHKLQKNIDNWTIQEYSKGTTVSTASPSSANPYLYPSKQIPEKYLTTTEPINHATDNNNNNIFTLAGFTFNDLNYKDSASNHDKSHIQVIQPDISKPAKSSTEVPATSTSADFIWRSFSIDISPVNKERVYVVTPQPIVTTPKSNPAVQKKEKAAKEAERNSKELKASKDTKKSTEKSTMFESIEKAYQVLPQAVNNLAVASTGPESVPLWGIMEHEYATNDGDEHANEDNESSELPVLHATHSKVSRARR
nr:PREDICTED: uncharacterized protein LOC105675934 [Linepithema humile]